MIFLTNHKTIEYYLKEYLLDKFYFHNKGNYRKNNIRNNFNEKIRSNEYEKLYLSLNKF